MPKQARLNFPTVKQKDDRAAGKTDDPATTQKTRSRSQAPILLPPAPAPAGPSTQQRPRRSTSARGRNEQLFDSDAGAKTVRAPSATRSQSLTTQAQTEAPKTASRASTRVTHRAPSPAPAPRTSTRVSRGKTAGTGRRTTQEAESPYKASKRSHGQGGKQGAAVQHFDRYEIDGHTYQIGDAVYVVRTEDVDELPEEDAEDVCVVCDKGNKSHTIIECDKCLGGYHMACLKPPLKKVPEGAWVCDSCVQGKDVASQRTLRHAYEKFLFTPLGEDVLSLGLITGFVKNRDGSGEVEFKCLYFCRPQDTFRGREAHHGSREVFLTTSEHFEPIECIWGPATVCSLEDFEGEEGTDVYYCEYQYDEQWKRFRRSAYNRRRAPGRATRGINVRALAGRADGAAWSASDADSESASDSDACDSDDSSDESFDARRERVYSDDEECVRGRNFKPVYAYWAEAARKQGRAAPAMRGRSTTGRRTALNKRTAGAALTGQLDDDRESYGVVLELSGGGGSSSQPVPANAHPLVKARRALATAAPPAVLPCRDIEKARLRGFVEDAVNETGGSGPGVLYVCGVPGTGKTACISEVLKELRPEARDKGTQLVFINALSLPSPTHVYSKLWEKLTGQQLGPARALAALEATFSPDAHMMQPATGRQGGRGGSTAPGRPCMTLLVVDEIDILITKEQAVLYNLFEWPMRPGARLAVIGISNTHDLDDRVLPRISSRLASSKLAFNAYTTAQLEEIATQRLQAAGCLNIIHKSGITFAARKVAASTGDVRRVLELLRRAMEAAETERRVNNNTLTDMNINTSQQQQTGEMVKVEHVQLAIKEMFTAPHMQFLKSCSRLQKLALVALLMEMRATNKPDASISALHDRLLSHISLLVPEARCEVVALCRAVFDLAAKRLVITSPTWHALKARVALNVHKDDVCVAVKDDTLLQPVHGQLS